jgi:hypothetical protein
MPNARSLGVAASMLAFNLPEGDVNSSRVEAGDRSDRISSVKLRRVGDREGVREWVRGGMIRGIEGERKGLSIVGLFVSISKFLGGFWHCSVCAKENVFKGRRKGRHDIETADRDFGCVGFLSSTPADGAG